MLGFAADLIGEYFQDGKGPLGQVSCTLVLCCVVSDVSRFCGSLLQFVQQGCAQRFRLLLALTVTL